MARVGEKIVNPVTGEEITWTRIDAEALEWEDVWTRPGHRAAPHVHPTMTERWRLIEGQAAFRIGDQETQTLRPGQRVEAPPGIPHAAWNPTDDSVVLHVSMTPPARWAEVVEKLFTWAHEGRTDAQGTPHPDLLVALLKDYADELAPPPAPRP